MSAAGRAEPAHSANVRYEIEACQLEPDGTVERLTVGGWCYRLAESAPAVLRVRIDDTLVRDIACDRRRDDVAQAFADSPDAANTSLPLCGFVIDLAAPALAATVRIEIAETGEILFERPLRDLRAAFLQFKVEAFEMMPRGVSESLQIEGWCYARAHPDPVQLRLTADGRTVGEYACRRLREDVRRLHGASEAAAGTSLPRCGFRIRLMVPGLKTRGSMPPDATTLRLESPRHGVVLAARDLSELHNFRSQVEFFRGEAPLVEGSLPFVSLQGWLYRRQSAGRRAHVDGSDPPQVVLTVDGGTVSTLECGIERPDVAQAHRLLDADALAPRGRCGFRARLPLPPGEIFTLSRLDGPVLARRTRASLLADAGLAPNPVFVSTAATRWDGHVDSNTVRPHVRELLVTRAGAFRARPTIAILIVLDRESDLDGVAATERALADQTYDRWTTTVVAPQNLAQAAAASTGEWLCVLTAGDRLAPQALFEAVRARQHGDPDILYADEDQPDTDGRRVPVFKPDWSPTRLRSCNFLGRPVFVNRTAHDRGGGFGGGEHALWLRLADSARVVHLPGVLCHRAARPTDALIDLDGPDRGPLVEILIPTHNRADLLGRCLRSLEKTTYASCRITIVDDRSDDPATLLMLEDARGRGIRVRRVDDHDGFSFARLNNRAVAQSRAELILLLNNDTEVRDPRWLSRMVALMTADVGAVGARLLYPDGAVQHAGVLLRVDGLAPGHELAGWPSAVASPGLLAEMAREVSAVTGACLLTRRAAWQAIQGLDETLAVSLNDIDYCLRLAGEGLRTVYAGGAVLTHHESASRGRAQDPAELSRFRAKHARQPDRYTNRNLEDGVLVTPECTLDFSDLKRDALRVAIAGSSWEARVCRRALASVATSRRIEIVTDRPEVVIVAGVSGYRDVLAAAAARRPVLWSHGGPVVAPGRDGRLDARDDAAYRTALEAAHAVVFGSAEARDRSRVLQVRENFLVNRIAVPGIASAAVPPKGMAPSAIREFGNSPIHNSPIHHSPGCRIAWIGGADADADPALFALAVHRLGGRRRLEVTWGVWEERPSNDRRIRRAAAIDRRAGRRQGEIGPLLVAGVEACEATDLFVSTGTGWEDPSPMLVAMAHGAAVLAPQECGMGERIAFGVNAWSYIARDSISLAARMDTLVGDIETRQSMARRSCDVFGCLWTFDEMAGRWADLVWGAWHRGSDR